MALRAEDQGFEFLLRHDFPGRVIPVTSKMAFQWLPCQTPGVTGSVLGLVGSESVVCLDLRKDRSLLSTHKPPRWPSG